MPVPTTGNPWFDVFTQLGAFGVVCFVVFWTFTKTVPRFNEGLKDAQEKFGVMLMAQQDKFGNLLVSQEGSVQALTKAFLDSNMQARELFAKELHEERMHNSSNIDRILAAIEHQNRLLIYLIGQIQGTPISGDQRTLLGLGKEA